MTEIIGFENNTYRHVSGDFANDENLCQMPESLCRMPNILGRIPNSPRPSPDGPCRMSKRPRPPPTGVIPDRSSKRFKSSSETSGVSETSSGMSETHFRNNLGVPAKTKLPYPIGDSFTKTPTGTNLREHQKDDLIFVRNTEKNIHEYATRHTYQRGGILYHDPGTGKTLVFLSYVYWLSQTTIACEPTLLVITKSLINVWRREIEKHFGTTLRVLIFHPEFVYVEKFSSTDIRDNYDLVITTYDILASANALLKKLDGLQKDDGKWDYMFCREIEECIHRDPCRPRFIKNVSPPKEIPESGDSTFSGSKNRPDHGITVLYTGFTFSRVILDESHLVANYNTKRWKLVWGIPTIFVWLSTGTLLVNSHSDVWSQLKLLGIPIKEKEWEGTKTMDIEDYWSWISRRTRNSLKNQIKIGEMEHHDVELELSMSEQVMYRIILDMCFQVVETYEKEKKEHSAMTYQFHDILEFFIATRKCCSFPFMLLGTDTKMEHRLRLMAETEQISPSSIRWLSEYDMTHSGWKSAKAKWVLNYCKVQLLENDDKIIIWSMFTCGLYMLKDLLSHVFPDVRIECLSGRLSTRERHSLEKDFFIDKKFRILLMHFWVGGLGMNLQVANRNIFMDPWWNWSRDIQALDRTHRPGQEKKVYCHALFIKDSIEQYLIQKTMQKKDLATNYEASSRGVDFFSSDSQQNSGFESLKDIIYKAFNASMK